MAVNWMRLVTQHQVPIEFEMYGFDSNSIMLSSFCFERYIYILKDNSSIKSSNNSAMWPNGKALDYDSVNQEIPGSTPGMVNSFLRLSNSLLWAINRFLDQGEHVI